MEENQFDLGEALGSYEQAQADRNFYLSMVQGGTQMASPIAAYLAGVAGVKIANQRAKVQNIEDARQAKLDATAAAEKAQKHAETVQGQIVNIMKGARDGSIAPGAAAAMLGPLTKELGYTLKQYDADNNQAIYNVPGDSNDYVFDLGESETSKSQRDWYKLQLAREAEARRREQGARSLDIQQQRANTYATRAAGSGSQKTTSLAGYKATHPNIFKLYGGEMTLEDPSYEEIDSLIKGVEGLSEADKKQVEEGIVPFALRWVRENHPDWTFSSDIKDEPGYVASPESVLKSAGFYK